MDLEDSADLYQEIVSDSKPDADPPSKLESSPLGRPISMCSSSDREPMTTLGLTFQRFPLWLEMMLVEFFYPKKHRLVPSLYRSLHRTTNKTGRTT